MRGIVTLILVPNKPGSGFQDNNKCRLPRARRRAEKEGCSLRMVHLRWILFGGVWRCSRYSRRHAVPSAAVSLHRPLALTSASRSPVNFPHCVTEPGNLPGTFQPPRTGLPVQGRRRASSSALPTCTCAQGVTDHPQPTPGFYSQYQISRIKSAPNDDEHK